MPVLYWKVVTLPSGSATETRSFPEYEYVQVRLPELIVVRWLFASYANAAVLPMASVIWEMYPFEP